MSVVLDLANSIKQVVDLLVLDKSFARPTLIEALEEAAADIESLLDALRDDERRARERE